VKSAEGTQSWLLRKPDGSTYGPVDLDTLKQWAGTGRVAPEDHVSADGKEWVPATELPALEMRWEVLLEGGGRYGPLNILAVGELLLDGSVSEHDMVQEVGAKEPEPVALAVIRGFQAERGRWLAELEDERSAWSTLLENERRAARRREQALREKLEQSRKLLKDLAQKLEQIEARVKSAGAAQARVRELEAENARLKEELQRVRKSAGSQERKAATGEKAPVARKAPQKPGGPRKGTGAATHPGIRLSADDVR